MRSNTPSLRPCDLKGDMGVETDSRTGPSEGVTDTVGSSTDGVEIPGKFRRIVL